MDKNNAEQELKKELLSYNIDKAKKIAFSSSFDSLCNVLISLAAEIESIYIYTFIIVLILEEETAKYHELASILLAQPLCFIEGAYAASLFHARKSLELEPDNVGYKQYLLFFYGLPDKVISNEEALKIAQEVIKVNSTSQIALRVIKELSKGN